MKRELSSFEEALVELVHFLSSDAHALGGQTPRTIRKFLTSPVASKGGLTPLELLEQDGMAFVNELKIYVNNMED